MCSVIHTEDGNEIECVEDLQKLLKDDAEIFLNTGYIELWEEGCLCQVDIEKTLDKAGIRWKHDGILDFVLLEKVGKIE